MRQNTDFIFVLFCFQWICAHARYFSGTHSSTFSFRIHEDREILGFDPESTFNCLCPDGKPDCEQPAKWKIVYSKEEFEKNLYGL
ncbi:unnamed protein product [Anisakis simplex]|uniref:GDP-fucose protein O-fucosyltransferase 2 (inferred by orthology to a C. elegans protein) n=1 Tax=Anisakis simplex TaxID=6269 RepID=A0A0M3JHB4_ANISI|nr:unnamed protein product [Anisakis simplex]